MQTIQPTLPSRRYTCKVCGRKGRRNNAPEQRLKEQICPQCEISLRHFDMITAHMPLFDIIKRKLRNKYRDTKTTTKDS
jgi:hypothetical protein